MKGAPAYSTPSDNETEILKAPAKWEYFDVGIARGLFCELAKIADVLNFTPCVILRRCVMGQYKRDKEALKKGKPLSSYLPFAWSAGAVEMRLFVSAQERDEFEKFKGKGGIDYFINLLLSRACDHDGSLVPHFKDFHAITHLSATGTTRVLISIPNKK